MDGTPDNSITPDQVLSESDPGDDTQRRFRYQAAYAAMLSLLIESNESVQDKLLCDVEELFCEHHDDILLKCQDQTYIAVQVKTRKAGLTPFKATDVQIQSAVNKFVKMEEQFPNSFTRFIIATNSGYWKGKKNESNLPYILELVKNEGEARSDKSVQKFIRNIPKEYNIISDLVIRVLQKVELKDDLPSFDYIENILAVEIGNLPDMSGKRLNELKKAAKLLTNAMFRAASLNHESPLQNYFAFCKNPAKEKTDAIIESKRITREKIHVALEAAVTDEALLRTWHHVPISELPKGLKKLELKMAAGGISKSNIDLAKDHKYSADHLLLEWFYKNRVMADQRYGHLRTIVRTECNEAHDLVERERGLYGQDMLSEIRKRLRSRCSEEKNSMFGCMYEHLLGIAGILTEECEIWWSEVFNIPNGE